MGKEQKVTWLTGTDLPCHCPHPMPWEISWVHFFLYILLAWGRMLASSTSHCAVKGKERVQEDPQGVKFEV